jgi:hypothetical protein
MTDGIDWQGDGFIDMYPADTLARMTELRNAGDDLRDAWNAALNRINSPGKIYHGPMGEALKGALDKTAVDAKTVVDQIPGFYQGSAAGGVKAVGIYRDGEAAATNDLTS